MEFVPKKNGLTLIEKFAERPPKKCYHDALKCAVKSYERLTNTNLTQLQGLSF